MLRKIECERRGGKIGISLPCQPYHYDATLDSVWFTTPEPWRGLRTGLEKHYGRRVRFNEIVADGVVQNFAIPLHQPSRALLRHILSISPVIPSTKGPRYQRRRLAWSGADLAINYWFRSAEEGEEFQRCMRLRLHQKWKLVTEPINDEFGLNFYQRNRALLKAQGRKSPPRDCLVYNYSAYHPDRVAHHLRTWKLNNRHLTPINRALPDPTVIRIELKLSSALAVRNAGLTLASIDQIDLAHVFDRNLALLKPRPRMFRKVYRDRGYGWQRLLLHRLIPRRFLEFIRFSSVLPVPTRLTIKD